MTQEDFTTWTETGVVARLSQTQARSTWTLLQRNDYDTLLYDTKTGQLQNFTYYFTFRCTAQLSATQTIRVNPFSVCQVLQDYIAHDTGNYENFGVMYRANASSSTIGRLSLFELNNGTGYVSIDHVLNVGTIRYLKITKAGTALKLQVYSDAAFTTLIDTLDLVLHANHNLPYLACPQSAGYATTATTSGYIQNLKDSLVEDGSTDLYAKFEVASPSGSADLYAKFDVGQGTGDLKGILVVRSSSSSVLKGVFTVRHSSSAALKGVFIIQHSSSANLKGIFTVRHTATKDLYARFVIRTGVDLIAEFEIRHSNNVDLKGIVTVRHSSSASLNGILIVRHTSTKDLYAKFEAQATAALKGVIIVQHSSSVGVKGILIVQHSSNVWLKGILIVRHSSAIQLAAKVFVTRPGSNNLMAIFATSTVNASPVVLKSIFYVRPGTLMGEGFRISGRMRTDIRIGGIETTIKGGGRASIKG